MSTYEDMRDFQRHEEGDGSPRPVSFTSEELAEMRHDHGEDTDWLVNELMERNMAGRVAWLERERSRLLALLHDEDK